MIVPKGLRSFDGNDADFFLELLPGPFDRDGLPESLRFWKGRIESGEADKAFAVGLIYGPSGCGKTSLVKAGLLPRLGDFVVPVYIEASAADTETRLCKALHKICPNLQGDLDLPDTLTSLRKGKGLPGGRKVLIVIDQFEQWLHATRAEAATPLAAALRQCDGDKVQCLLMVRDDFWLGVSRFVGDLEVELVQGQNMALVDLFDPHHARKVLTAFGQAFGALPREPASPSKTQEAFLEQAVSDLCQDGKIVSVRLALFAEMVKTKPWTPATLKEVGGIEGLGVTFLEETFVAQTAPPQHRFHLKAAQAVLRTLLPATGGDIKGQMQAREHLLEVSGYAARPKEFDALLRILDGELRLITPTDLEGKDEGGRMKDDPSQPADSSLIPHPSSLRHYQLTHDYLVPALRDWLTRKQKETRRGRAELRLAERAGLWQVKNENRHLPAFWEWAHIRLFTRKGDWTAPQKKMMRTANRYFGLRGMALAVLLTAVTAVGWAVADHIGEQRKAAQAAGLLEQLRVAEINQVPAIVEEIGAYRSWMGDKLEREFAAPDADAKQKLHFSLALLPVDKGQADYLGTRMLDADPWDVAVLRDSLAPHKEQLVERLWSVAERTAKGKAEAEQRLRTACALAVYDPKGARWGTINQAVAGDLVEVHSVHLATWMALLRPARQHLLAPLARVFKDGKKAEASRSMAAEILVDYASDKPALLADLLMDADDKKFAMLYPLVKDHGDKAAAPLRAELDKQLQPLWPDLPLDPNWKTPDGAIENKFVAAQGILTDRFAFCQAMALEEFLSVAEILRPCGYRPIRFRPYAAAGKKSGGPTQLLVAAVWNRDGQNWQLAHNLSGDEIKQRYQDLLKRDQHPVDVAGYNSDLGPRWAALWVSAAAGTLQTELEVDLGDEEMKARDKMLRNTWHWRIASAMTPGEDGSWRLGAIWSKPVERDFHEDVRLLSTGNGYERFVVEGSLKKVVADVEVDLTLGISTQGQGVYAAAWNPLAQLTSQEMHGTDLGQHFAICQLRIKEGYRPAAISVACQTSPGADSAKSGLVIASVWQCTIVPDLDKEILAKRQANAAVALLKMGRPEYVWPLLKHQDDSRLRSYVIHRLAPSSADPSVIVKRFHQEQEVSSRRACCWPWERLRPTSFLAASLTP